jgi:hypothetical protein
MFLAEPELVPLKDQPDFWALAAPIKWVSSTLITTIPLGFKTDLASIPKIIRNIFDVDGRSREPAILHDWLYSTQHTTKAFADEQLRLAIIDYGDKPWQARMYWLGVHLGGASAWRGHTQHPVPFDTREHSRAWVLSGSPV